MAGINRGIAFVRKKFIEKRSEIKGICRSLAFIFTASLIVLLLKSEIGWHVAVAGGLVGFFAYYGW